MLALEVVSKPEKGFKEANDFACRVVAGNKGTGNGTSMK